MALGRGFEPRNSCFRGRRLYQFAYPSTASVWRDLNPRLPGPRPGALPSWATDGHSAASDWRGSNRRLLDPTRALYRWATPRKVRLVGLEPTPRPGKNRVTVHMAVRRKAGSFTSATQDGCQRQESNLHDRFRSSSSGVYRFATLARSGAGAKWGASFLDRSQRPVSPVTSPPATPEGWWTTYGRSPPVEDVGLEPTASCLQGTRSSSDELVPQVSSFQRVLSSRPVGGNRTPSLAPPVYSRLSPMGPRRDTGRSVPSTKPALPFSMTIQFSSITLADAIMAGQRSGSSTRLRCRSPSARFGSSRSGRWTGHEKSPSRLGGAPAYSDFGSGLRRSLPIEFRRLPLAIGRGRRRARQ